MWRKLTSKLSGDIVVASRLGPTAYAGRSSVDLNVSNDRGILL